MKTHQWFPEDDGRLRQSRGWEELPAPAWPAAPLLGSFPSRWSHLTLSWALGKLLSRALQLEGFKELEATPQAQGSCTLCSR